VSRRALALVAVLLPTLAFGQPAPDDEKTKKDVAVRRELAKLDGHWELVSREVGGVAVPPAKLGKQTLILGSEVFVVRKGADVLQFGVNKIDPVKSPKSITIDVKGGENRDARLLGIYELGANGEDLRVVADPEGDFRPKVLKSEPMSKQVLSVYRRIKGAPGEQIEITGKYKASSRDVDGKTAVGESEIRRIGECYLVQYRQGRNVAYIGIGIRQADQLSVCWANGRELGLSVYKIEKGPKLVGGYAKLGGIGIINPETMVPLEEID